MGYTMSQIQNKYNDLVNDYKSKSFSEVPCSSVVNYSLDGIHRSVDLKSNIKDSSVRVKLISKYSNIDGLDIPVSSISLDVEEFKDHIINNTSHYNKFYCVDDNYYTSDIDELKHAKDVGLKRYLNFWDHHGKVSHVNIKKMSHKLTSYLKKAIDVKLGDRIKMYSIKDIYFSYTYTLNSIYNRRLVIVIKNKDKNATEAFWFDPSLMSMYINGDIV